MTGRATIAATPYGPASAPPLVFFRGLPAAPHAPRGVDAATERLTLRGTQGHRVHALGRPGALPDGADMAEIADLYGRALRRRFAAPVPVLATSTGASIALQLAADHPELVSALVVVSGAGRLGDEGRLLQRRYADQLEAGDRRADTELALATLDFLGAGPILRTVAPLLPVPEALETLVPLVRAEDGYDMLGRAHRISAPTLFLCGDHDAFYPPEVVYETARRIPHARVVLHRRCAHGEVVLRPGHGAAVRGFLHRHRVR
ncbi:alpha/beta hydrolase [Leifsonia sp. ZF2019]|uniref:alpha/beta fold hydrolase n=1 Tax=Leifsonia sp. ZF2019 TaxID=2781978 RepID=UPI001CC17738|nr:alpha/beta hydrolase [Leifsonia sp. ZF2019]UAJ80324.1 alpha/beta hydrolase [Leifsonia sp. ZF2019]